MKRLIVLLLLAWGLHADVPKKYNLSICAIFKNEERFLKEWIEYHRLIGVDHFYLYNNMSVDQSSRILAPYVKRGIVTLINWPDCWGQLEEDKMFMWALGTQVMAYEHAIKLSAGLESKWLVFVDVNEFLVPTNGDSFVDILEKYKDAPGIQFPSYFYDASKPSQVPRRKLVIESLDLTKPQENPQTGVAKTIFKPDQCEGFVWPPYQCLFANQQTSTVVKKEELLVNRYVNRPSGITFFANNYKEKLDVDNRDLTDEECSAILDAGYAIEDQRRSIYRFLTRLRNTLEYGGS